MNKKKMIMSKVVSVACAFFLSPLILACGDEASSHAPEPQGNTQEILSSSSVTAVSSTTDAVLSSSSAFVSDVASSASSFNRDMAVANLALIPDADGFYDIGEIYKAVPSESKIVFVLRHAERESGLGQESPLTEVGEQQALDAGKKLQGGDESFYYASTDFVRIRKTAANMAAGRGETAEVVTWEGINGGYFLTVPSDTLDALVSKRGGSIRYISQWAYDVPFTNKYTIEHGIDTYFYDLFDRGNQFVNEVVLANLPNWKRVNVLISHDLLLEPLAVFASNRQVDLRAYENYRWINYLAGIAVVVDASGLVTIMPARGTETGVLNTREAY